MVHKNFHPKKRFGQNFLIDQNIVRKIIGAAALKKKDIVLEIGPGKGVLTHQLIQRVRKVIAVEVDKKLFIDMVDSFSGVSNIVLCNHNILKFDLKRALTTLDIKNKIKIVANIPYSITAAILEYVFENIDLFSVVYLMVQKEFAMRLIAKPNTDDYSSLSCFAQFHTNPWVLFRVKRGCFRPQPKVDSCFVELTPRSRSKEITPDKKKILFTIVRTAFNQRRKNIVNALAPLLKKETTYRIFSTLALDYQLRAENLSLDDYVRITQEVVRLRVKT